MGKMRNYGSFVELGLENSGQLICNCLRMAFPCPLQHYSSTGYNGEKGQTNLRRPTFRDAKSGNLVNVVVLFFLKYVLIPCQKGVFTLI